MKLFHKAKDGGNESNVTGYWLIESKRFFSIVLLCFNKGSREAFHSHAFNALSWIIKGELEEHVKQGGVYSIVKILPSCIPIFTSRERMHITTTSNDACYTFTISPIVVGNIPALLMTDNNTHVFLS